MSDSLQPHELQGTMLLLNKEKTHKSKKVTVRETLMDGVVMIGNPLLHKVKSTGKVFFFACLFLINVFRILDIDQ